MKDLKYIQDQYLRRNRQFELSEVGGDASFSIKEIKAACCIRDRTVDFSLELPFLARNLLRIEFVRTV